MPMQDSSNLCGPFLVNTDGANTDFAITLPTAGTRGYIINRVLVADAQGGSSASALLGLFTAAAGGGTTIITAAALTTHTTSAIVSSRTIIAAAAQTTALTNSNLFLRVTTASGVTGTTVKVYFDITTL